MRREGENEMKDITDYDKIVEFHIKDSIEKQSCRALRAWPLGSYVNCGNHGKEIYLTADLPYKYDKNGICLIYRYGMENAIYYLKDRPIEGDSIWLGPKSPYTCHVEGQTYYPMGFGGQSWGRFGLEDCYFILTDHNPKWEFVRGRQIFDSRGSVSFKAPEIPAIKSLKDDQYNYYLESEVEAINDKCILCGKSLWQEKETIIEVYFDWWRYADKFKMQSKTIEKLREQAPEWVRYSQFACSLSCREILLRKARKEIKERIELWAKKKHDQEKVERLRKMMPQVRKSLKYNNQDALLSLQKEFAREAISLK